MLYTVLIAGLLGLILIRVLWWRNRRWDDIGFPPPVKPIPPPPPEKPKPRDTLREKLKERLEADKPTIIVMPGYDPIHKWEPETMEALRRRWRS